MEIGMLLFGVKSRESSVGFIIYVQWVCSGKFSGCDLEISVGAHVYPIQCNCITVDRVGELKDLMTELLWAFVFALYFIVVPGNEIPGLIYYLVPFFFFILVVITEAFHILSIRIKLN